MSPFELQRLYTVSVDVDCDLQLQEFLAGGLDLHGSTYVGFAFTR